MSATHSARLRAFPLDLPLARTFRTARGPRTHTENVLVEIEAEGIVGRGEGVPHPRYGQDQAGALQALRAFEIPAVSPFDQGAWIEAFRQQAPTQIAARAALEIALWDWAGRRTGQRLSQMLSLDIGELPPSSWTVSIDDEAGIEARVDEAANWPILKIKLDGSDRDRRTLQRLRTLTDRPFRVDANESWDPGRAQEEVHWLASLGCELVEQPFPAGHLEETARLREKSPLPLIADEDAVPGTEPAALAEAYDGVNLKLSRLGGIAETVRYAHAATAAGLQRMLGCFVESSVGISAACHLAALARWIDLDGAALLAEDPFQGCRVRAGRIEIPARPGLGLRDDLRGA